MLFPHNGLCHQLMTWHFSLIKFHNIPALKIFKELCLVCYLNLSVKLLSIIFFHIGGFIILSIFKIIIYKRFNRIVDTCTEQKESNWLMGSLFLSIHCTCFQMFIFHSTEFFLVYRQHLLQTKLYSNISFSFLLFLLLNFDINFLRELCSLKTIERTYCIFIKQITVPWYKTSPLVYQITNVCLFNHQSHTSYFCTCYSGD
jgi:hypothetical protein